LGITPFRQIKAFQPEWAEESQRRLSPRRKKGVWREVAGTPCSISAGKPEGPPKKAGELHTGKKEAGGDEPHAGKWQPLLELLSKHGRRIRFQKHPIA